jgi:hypothetical protein
MARELGLSVVMVLAAIITIVAVARRPEVGTTDFRTFYQSSRQFLANTDPYVPYDRNRGPNLNPPWIVAVMAQLCRLPLPLSVVVWWAFGFGCLFASIALIARTVAPGHAVTLASVVLVTQASYANVRLGQVAWPLMLLMTAAWVADRQRQPLLAGALLGLAASWKPFLLVFAPYVIWRREWRALGAMALAIAITIVIGWLAVGAAGYTSWFAMVRTIDWAGHPLNASIRALVSRTLTTSSLVEQTTTPLLVAPAWLDPVWLVGAAAVGAIAVRFIVSSNSIDVAWAALILTAILVSPLGWIHYVVLVTGPLAAVTLSGRRCGMRLVVVGVALLSVPFAWLKAGPYGPVLTLTLISCYTWGALCLFASISSSVPKTASASV